MITLSRPLACSVLLLLFLLGSDEILCTPGSSEIEQKALSLRRQLNITMHGAGLEHLERSFVPHDSHKSEPNILPELSVREFRTTDLPGEYNSHSAPNGTNCPNTLSFADQGRGDQVTEGNYTYELYPIAGVSVNGNQCSGEEPLRLLTSAAFYSFQEVAPSDIVSELAGKTDFLILFNTRTAVCGSYRYARGIAIAVLDAKDIQIGNATIPRNTKIFLYGDSEGCNSIQLREKKGARTSGESTEAPPTSEPSSAGLSRGAIAGIGVGGFVFVAVLILSVSAVPWLRRRAQSRGEASPGGFLSSFDEIEAPPDEIRNPPNELGDD